MQAAALMKIQFVLELARKNKDFFLVLRDDPANTLRHSGIDLSIGEQEAVLDIVKGREESPYAPRLGKLRDFWSDVKRDMSAAFGNEAGFVGPHRSTNPWK